MSILQNVIAVSVLESVSVSGGSMMVVLDETGPLLLGALVFEVVDVERLANFSGGIGSIGVCCATVCSGAACCVKFGKCSN